MDEERIIELIKQTVTPMLEEQLLLLVETYANVVQEKTVTKSLVEKFYADNPTFRDHKDITANVIEKIQGDNPGVAFSKLLEKATPEIKRHIDTIGGLDMTKGVKPVKPMFESDLGVL